MKTLIIHGSPRPNGDSSSLAYALKGLLSGEFIELSVYRDKISPCIDCRYCAKKAACSINDDMQLIFDDRFDRVILTSPVYMGTLPGPLVSLASRFQVYFSSKFFREETIPVRTKPSVLILTGGGNGKADEALRLGKMILGSMGGANTHVVTSLCTDKVPATSDIRALERLRELAELWN